MSFRVFVCVLFSCLLFALRANAVVTHSTEYAWSQSGTNGYANSAGPAPLDISTTDSTPLSTYEFNLNAIPTDPFELKASAGFTVDIDQRGTQENWSNLSVAARAKSTLVDTGIVDALGTTDGVAIFSWVLSGVSDIDFDARGPNALGLNELSTSALLTSNVPSDSPDPLENVLAPVNGVSVGVGNEQLTSFVPAAASVQQFIVPWAENSIPILFDLDVSARLNVFNADAAGFKADVLADYSNTASLSSVLVYDANGTLLPEATIVGADGFDYTAVGANVPEPSTVWLSVLAFAIFAAVHRKRLAT